MSESKQALQSFIDEWSDTEEKNKQAFLRLKARLETMDQISLDFVPRPGLTYSLRGIHPNQQKRPLFVMIDVIEDSPRWLSVCFYGEMISDPEEQGDFVPEGLLGEDATCFDIEAYDKKLLDYVETRMREAHQRAVQE
ncbi:MAG: hypothetical protein JJV98_06065 [Desulfosarcina sp.]|nr:hypothetical protein [Desulfobacterales bacterium]